VVELLKDQSNPRIVAGPSEATLHVVDFGIYASLLFQNTPTGRILDPDMTSVEIWEDLPPPVDMDSFDKGGAGLKGPLDHVVKDYAPCGKRNPCPGERCANSGHWVWGDRVASGGPA